MAKSKVYNVHVVPSEEGWAVKTEGTGRVNSLHDTQKAAIDSARSIARREAGELIVHARSGRIRERDSYNNDPIVPKSREVLFPTGPRRKSEKTIERVIKEVLMEREDAPRVARRSR